MVSSGPRMHHGERTGHPLVVATPTPRQQARDWHAKHSSRPQIISEIAQKLKVDEVTVEGWVA